MERFKISEKEMKAQASCKERLEQPPKKASPCEHELFVTGAMTRVISLAKDAIREEDIRPDWESRGNTLLQQHFGYPSLKRLQKEALTDQGNHYVFKFHPY
nr:ATP-dependent DNA helicase Q-like SIM isoform X1 [Tanacetum cinerariifolium]